MADSSEVSIHRLPVRGWLPIAGVHQICDESNGCQAGNGVPWISCNQTAAGQRQSDTGP